jgi:hypothetical protein
MTMEFCDPPRRPFLARGTTNIGLHGIVDLKDDRVVTVRGAADIGKVMVRDTIRATSRKLRTKWSVSSAPDLLVGNWTPAMLNAEVGT